MNVTAIILAAGDSSRMGSPKALLDFDGRPMIELVIETARAGGCTGVLVVLGADAEAIKTGADLTGCTLLVNEHTEQGQISSIKLGMRSLDFSNDACIVWPVDCPLAGAGDVKALIDTYKQWRASLMRIFIPTFKGERGHPMLVDIGFRQPFMELGPDETAHKVIEDKYDQVKEVETDNHGVLSDVDTPADYDRVLADWQRRNAG